MTAQNQTQTYQPKREYVLTDGFDTYATRCLTEAEAKEQDAIARQASDNEMNWVLKFEFEKMQAWYAQMDQMEEAANA